MPKSPARRRFIVSLPRGVRLNPAQDIERAVCQHVSAAAQVEDYEDMLTRVSNLRIADRLQTVARDRALQRVAARINHIQGAITARNYGVAEEAMTELVRDLEDDQGPCYIVQKELDRS
jgi:hypothetical protein